jgi:SHS2 domain-containing protein
VRHDPARHGRGVEVKAVTYHGLRFGRTESGWELWVLLDI